MTGIDFVLNSEGFDIINTISKDDGKSVDKYKLVYDLAFERQSYDQTEIQTLLQKISSRTIALIINTASIETIRDDVNIKFNNTEYEKIMMLIPDFSGKHFVTLEWVQNTVNKLVDIFKNEIRMFDGSVDLYFTSKRNVLITPSKIYFHLVESTAEEGPFAFMVTYSVIKEGNVHHLPLKALLKEFDSKKMEFRNLTKTIYNVAKESGFIKRMVKSGEIFAPIYLSEQEAYQFLKEISIYEENGIICRVPNWWSSKDNNATIEVNLQQRIDDSFHYFKKSNLANLVPQMKYNGVTITKEEIEELLVNTEGLALVKGKWIEIDKKLLKDLLKVYETYNRDGTTFSELIRMPSVKFFRDAPITVEFDKDAWLKELINKSIDEEYNFTEIPSRFKGTLRPYQIEGFHWISGMLKYGFGVCLADDMGLGKTIQILAYLLKYSEESDKQVLLIVPPSLMRNWEKEILKFAPDLSYCLIKSSNYDRIAARNKFLVITTYQLVQNIRWMYDIEWGIVILDEAQMIKNPDTITAKKIKSLKRDSSIVLTGTPIENNLVNLWSIFDFINPGLLGSQTEFRKIFDVKGFDENNVNRLSKIVKPFILRRLKTDKNIISDLPDKIEKDYYPELSKTQVILYNRVVSEIVGSKISEVNQFNQKKILLTAIMHLKQICNHPSQYLGDKEYNIEDSGKYILLKEICEGINDRKEKVIVFTQFTEITVSLNKLLKDIFGIEGYVITGKTTMTKRNEYVQAFQNDKVPYMILSLKTAGVGLNLTKATNVIHFDRWWNPAVENQATDRTYRIGQENNVTVYKFITKDTVEEIIDSLMDTKTKLSDSVLGSLDESILKKLSTEELIDAIRYRGNANE